MCTFAADNHITIIIIQATMKKIYLALMCMASLSLMTACGDKKSDKGDAKDENKTEEVADNDEQDIDDEELEPQPTSEEYEGWGDPTNPSVEPLVLADLYATGDFKPAPTVVFEDTLSQDSETVGELPSKWDITDGGAEIALTAGHYYIKMLGGTTVLKPKGGNDLLPSKYTMEFEFVFGNDVWYHVLFYDAEGNEVGNYLMTINIAEWNFMKTNEEWMHGDKNELGAYINREGWNHFAASYDNGNMKLYVNGIRIANMANVSKASYFTIVGDEADGDGHFIRSIRVCK